MEVLRIAGGIPLTGSISASGAKNAALPIMAASLLADEPIELSNVPQVSDVVTLARVLSDLGLAIERPANGRLLLQQLDRRLVRPRRHLVRRMRASFCVLGPLLAKRRRAIVPLPGGCCIGDRPIDLHLKGLAALGADLRISRGHVVASAKQLRGATIDLAGPRGPTVTGTANILCAAALAKGETRIRSAAREPEIENLGDFLIRLGARIEGLGTDEIRIRGVGQLGGCSFPIMPDRIEAGTFLIAAAITAGSVQVCRAAAAHLESLLDVLARFGCEISIAADRISLCRHNPLRAVDFVARPFPGIPTDLQPHLTVLAALARGRSRIADEVFPRRFRHARALRQMGAKITSDHCPCKSCLCIGGVRRLQGASVFGADLRGGAALVLAGLAAAGVTTVRGLSHIERGYERFDEKLSRLGARMDRVQRIPAAAAPARC